MSQDPFKPPQGYHPTWFYILLWKRYFDTGLSITSYLKYVIAFFGLASRDVSLTLWIAIGYAVGCFMLGWGWHRFNFVRLDNEIANRFNDFVKEMREKINQ